MKRILLLTMLLALAAAPAVAEPPLELRSTLSDQQEVAVTIYNDNLALVRDQRKVNLRQGENRLALREVSAGIRPETALLRSLGDPDGVQVIEQNFDFDLLTPQTLLEKYVGKTVQVVRVHPQTGEDSFETAEVLAASGGVVLKIGDRIETGVPGRLVYPDVPADLRDRPTLVLQLHSAKGGEQQLELAYLTSGLSWNADYVAQLSEDDSTLDLSGWVTLTNRSGTSYRSARLQLVAGDVNQVRQPMPMARDLMMEKGMVAASAPMPEESLFEYHLYSLGRPTTLRENQTKQVSLLSAAGVPAVREYLLQGGDYYYRGRYDSLGEKLKVGVFLELANREEAGLGMPLPKGIVRVYKKDRQGSAQFVGEDRIDHTPKNERVRLKLGDAFDVTANRKQTDFQKLGGSGRYNYVFESAYQIVLNNAKTEPVTVRVAEPMPGDWEILSESHPHRKETAGTASWQIKIPAESSATLTYRVRVRF
ncbi:DUF4139 domain-containing protein [Trichloromonas sp.]|uniref:DUF4139 domain-containing protein n=1 Tax=Trichloromonas sp. TaxID=3069249 RepID=UPI003D81B43F